MTEALFITATGMGGVFAFLLLLVFAMNILQKICKKTDNNLEKIAIAVAMVQRGK